MRSTKSLALSPLWQTRPEHLSFEERVKLSYERTKSLVEHYRLTRDDLLNISPKYWKLHNDPIMALDSSAGTLTTIHYNLCTGTLAKYTTGRPDLTHLIDKLLKFEISGQFCLTEIGHGLDVINMETTATMLPDGSFDLNTPSKHAAKFMPPTSPCGIPVVAVVFARLVVDGEDRGPKPFVVQLSDGFRMSKGVVCQVLAPRGGARPVKHALTTFQHVRLPVSALLGSPKKSKNAKAAFFSNISRVISGTLSMGSLGVGALQICAYVGGKYSMRRQVTDASTGRLRPIISFSTQYIPVLTTVAQAYVCQAYSDAIYRLYTEAKGNLPYQHFLAAIFKVTLLKFAAAAPLAVGDRCGAQGLAEVNQLASMNADARGAQIAEGDMLTISIRFAMELLIGRIEAPTPSDSDSILFKHESSMIDEIRQCIPSTLQAHRLAQIEAKLLPHAQPLIEAIGHRMAYEAAVSARVDSRLIELFLASVMKHDSAWYSENLGITRAQQAEMEGKSAGALYPELDGWLEKMDVRAYVTAPIVSEEKWDGYVDSLKRIGDGDSEAREKWVSSYEPVFAQSRL